MHYVSVRQMTDLRLSPIGSLSTLVDDPTAPVSITFAVIAQFQQPIFGVVALAAIWALQVTSPSRPLMVIVFRDGEDPATAAGD